MTASERRLNANSGIKKIGTKRADPRAKWSGFGQGNGLIRGGLVDSKGALFPSPKRGISRPTEKNWIRNLLSITPPLNVFGVADFK